MNALTVDAEVAIVLAPALTVDTKTLVLLASAATGWCAFQRMQSTVIAEWVLLLACVTTVVSYGTSDRRMRPLARLPW